MDDVYQYWFCYSFIGTSIESGQQSYASVYIGYMEDLITKDRITEAKEAAGVRSDCVLLSVTRLGYMTKAIFVGDSDD